MISSCQESWNFENWKLEMENIFSLVCKGVKIIILPALKVMDGGGVVVVNLDFSLNSAPFVSELRL